jgi:hypothetical protein
MSDIFEKYAAARAKYPEDIARIEAEEAQVKQLIEMQEYAQHPVTKRVLGMCRADVVTCRRRLATDRTLLDDPETQAELWAIIDARLWVIGLLGKDYQGELQLIEASLEPELTR